MSLEALLAEARGCALCHNLPLGPRPILQMNEASRILIASQAPGRIAHEKGVPFDDASGNRLRDWMGVSRDAFYDPSNIAILPMGFCYPGKGKGGDLPPRPECAPAWRARFMALLSHVRLTLVIGQYAQAWHLAGDARPLTEKVREQDMASASIICLPHPSPRNGFWLRANPWFEGEAVPKLRRRVGAALQRP